MEHLGEQYAKRQTFTQQYFLKNRIKSPMDNYHRLQFCLYLRKTFLKKKMGEMECTSVSCPSRGALKLLLNDGLWKTLIVRYRISLLNVPFSDGIL